MVIPFQVLMYPMVRWMRIMGEFMHLPLLGTMRGIVFAYLGFDTISTSAEEAINPQKSLPRSIIITLLICTAFYIVVCLILTGMVPYSQLGKGDALAYVLEVVGQGKIAGIVSLGAVLGLLAGPLATMYASIRILYTMSRDGLLPKKLSHYRLPSAWHRRKFR